MDAILGMGPEFMLMKSMPAGSVLGLRPELIIM